MPRGRVAKHAHRPTEGGRKIRALRESAGLSQAVLAADAAIGTAHLQKIEVGIIRKPDFETLSAVLSALSVRYTDRHDVLEAFGYKVPHDVPTQAEITWAIQHSIEELNDVTVPAYLMDDSQRLLAWNSFVPRLIGLRPDDPALAQFAGVTTIDLALNPAYRSSFSSIILMSFFQCGSAL